MTSDEVEVDLLFAVATVVGAALLLPLTYLSIFIHELGHAILGRAAGFVVTSFGIGIARPFFVRSVCGTRIFLCRSHPLQGITFCSFPNVSPPRQKTIAYFAGGIVANALFAVASLALWAFVRWGGIVWLPFALVNGLFAVSSLLPVEWKVGSAVVRSDGKLILLALLKRTAAMPAPVYIQSVNAFRGLWEAIGDRMILHANLVNTAAFWTELEDLERAEADFAAAGEASGLASPPELAREALVRAGLASGRGRFDESATAIETAEACFREASDEKGRLYAQFTRIQLLTAKGEIGRALAQLEALDANPLARSDALIRIESVLVRLTAAITRGDGGAIEENVRRYELERRKQHSATRDLRVYRALAQHYSQLGDWQKAAPAFESAAAAIQETASAWALPADLARFLERHAAFLTQAGDCLRGLNKADDAERIVEPLRSVESFQLVIAAKPRERNRRLLRMGLRLMAADAICAGILVSAAIALFFFMGRASGPEFFFVAVALEFIFFTVIAGLYLVFHATVGRRIPSLRDGGGAIILILCAIPWLSLVVVPLVPILDRFF
jgi:tetratricopeptide (TPR) repeat protein